MTISIYKRDLIYGLAFIGVNMYWQYIVKGLIILLAVIIDMRKYAKRK